jgi:hypothetical protein
MNTALLVLRIIPGLLLMGRGLQQLGSPGYSPLLHAAGHRGTGAGFESLGIRPASPTNTAVVECTIPPDMTIERWRRLRRSTAPTQRDPWSRLLAAARRVARHGERRCDHLHDTVSRYDHAAKRLELLLTCPVCETEKLIHSLAYEPRFEPSVASVHALHPREGAAVDALDRAA